MNSLFYQLMQVAVGTRHALVRRLTDDEWLHIFVMARTHALIGVAYGAICRLPDEQKPDVQIYDKWGTVARRIVARNEMMTRESTHVCGRLEADGMQCCVLKGQANLRYYPMWLRELRMAGDIDVWCWSSGYRVGDVIGYALSLTPDAVPHYHHVDCRLSEHTDVELHYRPSWLASPLRNFRLQRWFRQFALQSDRTSLTSAAPFPVPSVEFDAVFQLTHLYCHVFSEGIGLRQMLDYYFVLKALAGQGRPRQAAVLETVSALGMRRFAAATMYVLQHVFAAATTTPTDYPTARHPLYWQLLPPDPKAGSQLLAEIMRAGNLGKYDSRITLTRSQGRWRWGMMKFLRNLRFLTTYPEQTLCEPFFRLYHWVWRRCAK